MENVRTSLEGYPGNWVVVSLYISEMPWGMFCFVYFSSQLVSNVEMVFPYPDKTNETGGVEPSMFPEQGSLGSLHHCHSDSPQMLSLSFTNAYLEVTQCVDCRDKMSS